MEVPGYVPAWRAFELAGAQVVHLPMDGDGLRTDLLEERARKLAGRLKAVYVTPHHQYPTSVSLTPERRLLIAPGSAHLPEGRLDALRFGFAAHDTDELSDICEVLARCVPR